jgi:hypothetical protein
MPALVDEADVHCPHLFDVAPVDRVEPQNLRITKIARFFRNQQAGGVVAARLRLARAADHGAPVRIGNVHRNRVKAFLEVGAHRANEDVMQVILAGVYAQRRVGGDHHRPDIERTRRGRHPLLIELDELHDRLEMLSSSTSGIAIRRAELLKRRMFSQGRNRFTLPSGRR